MHCIMMELVGGMPVVDRVMCTDIAIYVYQYKKVHGNEQELTSAMFHSKSWEMNEWAVVKIP